MDNIMDAIDKTKFINLSGHYICSQNWFLHIYYGYKHHYVPNSGVLVLKTSDKIASVDFIELMRKLMKTK